MPHRFNLGAVGFDDTLVFLELFVGLEQKVAQMLNILLLLHKMAYILVRLGGHT